MSETEDKKHICDQIVTKISKLARIRLTKDEAEHYRKDFVSILRMFEQLDDLPADPQQEKDILLINIDECRDDEIGEAKLKPQLDQFFTHYNNETNYFDVPQFIDQDE